MATATTTPAKNSWSAKDIGCLWSRTKQGTTEKYFTGIIDLKNAGVDKKIEIVVFKNKDKKEEKHPDCRIYISEKRPATPSAAPAPAPAASDDPLI
jgi:uncharacterized protein (DUF736 family)